MDYKIRRCTEEDFPALAELCTAAYPPDVTRFSAAYFRFIATAFTDPRYSVRRHVLEVGGHVAGMSNVHNMIVLYHPQKFFLSVVVHPEYQNRGYGTALYDHIRAGIAPAHPIKLWARCRDDMDAVKRFLKKRGFVADYREFESRLVLSAFDESFHEMYQRKMTEQGITICDLKTLRKQPDWEQRLYEIVMHIQADMPVSDTFTPMPFEDFKRTSIEAGKLIPEGYFVARDGDRLVGVSILERDLANPKKLLTDDTGVHRDYRRRGIATALKLHALSWAKRAGYEDVRTLNESSNRAMLAINESLGFVKFPAWLGYMKELHDGVRE